MVCCSNRLCSCSVHCFPNDCLVRSDRVSERRITGSPSSIGKLARHTSQSKFPEIISAFALLALTRERPKPQSGQRISASKLFFIELPFHGSSALAVHALQRRAELGLERGLRKQRLTATGLGSSHSLRPTARRGQDGRSGIPRDQTHSGEISVKSLRESSKERTVRLEIPEKLATDA